MPDPIDFYFDFASPYAYLASVRIDDLAERHGRKVSWRPVLLGAVFKITGTLPNMHQPLRGNYLRCDTLRCARLYNIPYQLPERMPLNSVAAARAFWWASEHDPAGARRLAHAVFRAHWADGDDPATPEAVADLAAGVGLDRAAVLLGICQEPAKQRLRAETDGAIARGVFGAPFFFIDDEPFWGADRLEQMDLWLSHGGW